MINTKIKNIIKSQIKRIFYTRYGKKLFESIVLEMEKECIEALGREYNISVKYSNIKLPKTIETFEDLYFLFWCSPLNRGIIRVDLDEASYMYKLVKSLENPVIVEIGRFKGGSTLLIASAMKGGRLISLDLHLKMMLKTEGNIYDEELKSILKRYGVESKVEIVVADSKRFPNENLEVDFIFIDGDHSYEGVKADYEHWIDTVKRGGHILFHDACNSRPYATLHEGIQRLVKELKGNNTLIIANEIGSLIHFVKK